MREYFRMLLFAKQQISYLLLGVIFMMLSAIFDFAQIGAIIPIIDKIFNDKAVILPEGMPDFVVSLVDKINSYDQIFLFKALIIGFPILYLLRGITNYLKGLFMDIVAHKTMVSVKNTLYKKYQELSLDFYSKKRQGELISRITNDVQAIGNSMSYGLTDTFYQSIQAIGFTAMALMLNWKLVFIVVLMFSVIGWLMHTIGRQLKGYMRNSQEILADLNTLLSETIQGVRIIKGFSRQDHEIERCEQINNQYYKCMLKGIRRMKLLSPLTEIVGVFAVVVILIIGGRDVLDGKQSFGVFAGLIAALLSIMRPVKKVANAHGINQQGIAASERIYDILDVAPKIVDKENAVELMDPKKSIVFDSVNFSYDKEDGLVLKKISHEFPVGKTTAIVGPTGCGKSTILNLISRFYDPDSGTITVDGVDIRDVTVSSLLDKMGIVTQDMVLFHESIRENLKYGKLDATDEEIEEACKKALAWDFILKLPEGLDTIIGDRGFRLSGGQKQRLCIARAILRDPQILLLDEATSALDAESESLVQQALDYLMENRTVLVVAHRLSTIKHASCILVVENGEITDKGTHDELIASSKLYEKLAKLNFSI